VWTSVFRPLGPGGAPLFRRRGASPRGAAPRGARLFCPPAFFFEMLPPPPKCEFYSSLQEREEDKRLHGKLRPVSTYLPEEEGEAPRSHGGGQDLWAAAGLERASREKPRTPAPPQRRRRTTTTRARSYRPTRPTAACRPPTQDGMACASQSASLRTRPRVAKGGEDSLLQPRPAAWALAWIYRVALSGSEPQSPGGRCPRGARARRYGLCRAPAHAGLRRARQGGPGHTHWRACGEG